MKLPNDPVDRKTQYNELVRQCLASREERFNFYKTLRNYYLFGTQDESGAPYNKIESTIDTLASFIYSPEGTRFSLELGVSADRSNVAKAQPLAREISEQWRAGGTHMNFGLAGLWSLVFGSMILKVQWRRGLARTYIVEPHQFGVLREDIVQLSDQEAFCMCYTITRTQLESDLEGNPRRESIMRMVNAGRTGSTQRLSEGMSRLLISNPVGGVPGSVAASYGNAGGTVEGGMSGGAGQYNYGPVVDTDLVDMVDLYVWSDEDHDYQVVTTAAPDVVIYDRPQRLVGPAGMPHFVRVTTSNKLYNYFWGDSYVARLAWLQDWRTEDVANIRLLNSKQADPPIVGTGMTGIAEEKLLALRRAGGRLSMSAPTGKIDTLAPKMPENAFASLSEIDRMFDDAAGIGHILQGKGEAGVRSRGQADLMARLGSARPKQKALVLEDCAAETATLMLRCVQEESDKRFIPHTPDGQQGEAFVAAQFTRDFEVKVDAHSSSPIFVEDRKQDAAQLLEAHVIDRETFLEMYDPPNLQVLQERLKLIQQREAQQQAQQQAQAAQAQAGSGDKPTG